ncbi:MAG: ABC transporter ATP-binding protein [Pseudomonadota bacterium]|nr:ABC transporter ATP-binding protein [Pseudomonadota bacterium]
MTAPLLEVENLCLSFGAVQVARNISFALHPGDRTAVIGPNGAGKTTLVNMLTGIVKPDSGRLQLLGRDMLGQRPHQRVRAGLGRTYQITNLFQAMTVFENIYLPVSERLRVSTRLFRPAAAERQTVEEVWRILEIAGLRDHAGARISDLPYGLRRLVELAIALSLHPKVLLLDEPAAGIPSDEARMVQQVVDRLPGDIAVLLVEHDMELVFRFASRIIVLVEGGILCTGSPGEIAADPVVRQVYLGQAA